MTNWPKLIALGWPGAAFETHAFMDVPLLARVAGDAAVQTMLDAANKLDGLVLDHYLVVWVDEELPMPTRDEIISRKDELQAQLDELTAAREKAKAFQRQYPYEKLVAELKDESKRQEVIDAALAVE